MCAIRVQVGDHFVPPESDVVFRIDFDPTNGSPARVFDIAAELIRSLEEMDHVLLQPIDSRLETTFILEDLQKSSIKVFLKNVIKQLDDDALKSLDWKPLVGQYLVKAKYAAIKWLDENGKAGEPPSIADLTEEVAKLARETDVRHLLDYPPPNPTRLAQALDHFQEAKAKFRSSEGLTITLGREDYTVDINSTWLPSEHIPDSTDSRQLSNEQDMILVIKRADFLGKAKWQFKHGRSTVEAAIADDDWMREFKQGSYPIRPGDALRVRIRFEYTYGDRGELLDTDYTITKVFGVIDSGGSQGDLLA